MQLKLRNWMIFALAGLLVSFTSCGRNDVNQIEDLQAVSVFSQKDQLPRTMAYIDSIRRYQQSEFQKNVTSGLNRWYSAFLDSDQVLDFQWNQCELIETLPEGIRSSQFVEQLDDDDFKPVDAHFIQQASWLKSIARRIRSSERLFDFNFLIKYARSQMTEEELEQMGDTDDILAYVIWKLHPQLQAPQNNDFDVEDFATGNVDQSGTDSLDRSRALALGDLAPDDIPERDYRATTSQQLAAAYRLFDWTVRNVQLRTDLPWPSKADVIRNSTFDPALGKRPDWPPAAGVAGPGYRRFPWQLLTYGHGDYLAKSLLFLELLEQSGLQGIMLAVPTEGDQSSLEDRPYQEWLTGVLIDGRIYLFDMELGIPFPGEKTGTIATLGEVKDNPSLISRLSLTAEESTEAKDYRIQHERLDTVVALIPAMPESLSRRMGILEASLTGSERLRLTRDVDAMASRFAQLEHIDQVRLWHTPFSTHQYRDVTNQALGRLLTDQSVQNKLQWYPLEEGYIDQFPSFRSAINLYIRGRFETPRNDPRPNALTAFNRFTYRDDEIASFEQDVVLQRDLGIYKPAGQSFAEWQNQLLYMKAQMKRIRADATFYLALSHYENGFPSVALNWLNRIDVFDQKARWLSAVNYLQARAQEAVGEFDQAIRSYRRLGSPQRYGNVLRARLLETVVADDAT